MDRIYVSPFDASIYWIYVFHYKINFDFFLYDFYSILNNPTNWLQYNLCNLTYFFSFLYLYFQWYNKAQQVIFSFIFPRDVIFSSPRCDNIIFRYCKWLTSLSSREIYSLLIRRRQISVTAKLLSSLSLLKSSSALKTIFSLSMPWVIFFIWTILRWNNRENFWKLFNGFSRNFPPLFINNAILFGIGNRNILRCYDRRTRHYVTRLPMKEVVTTPPLKEELLDY